MRNRNNAFRKKQQKQQDMFFNPGCTACWSAYTACGLARNTQEPERSNIV